MEPNLAAAGHRKEVAFFFFFFKAIPEGLAQTPLVGLGKHELPWSLGGLSPGQLKAMALGSPLLPLGSRRL